MAIIGDSLTNPESGYTRYEIGSPKTSDNINWDYVSASGDFFYGVDAYNFRSAFGYVGTIAYIKIKNTSKFRVLSCLPSSANASELHTDNMVVEINGTKYTTNLQTNTSTSIVDYYLAVDVTGLSKNTTYIVKIYSEPTTETGIYGGRFNIQAIDVDTNAIVGFNLNMSNMFKGCTSLTQDITIPSNADSVIDMFKGCTSMTHIRSNWNNDYNSEITSTDCYSGCTAITHIDGESIIKSDYSEGLDQVPISWGGYGFFNDITTIIEIEVPSDNYTFNPIVNSNLFTINQSPKIVWGDNTSSIITNLSDTTQYSHVYENAGTYIIKGHFSFGNGLSNNKKELKKVFQICVSKNLSYAFYGCSNLTYVNLSATTKECAFGNTFRSCSSLETVDGLEYINPTETASIFEGCTSLTRLNGIQSLNMSIVSSAANMFKNCTSLSLLNISNWDTRNVRNMNAMFANTTSLESLDLSTWNVNNVTYMNSMFANTSLESLDLSAWNVNNVADMKDMFALCSSLTSLNLSGWDVSNVTNMSYMFNGDHYLSELNLSTWVDNGTKAKDLSGFFKCNVNEGSFITITLPNIKINNATDMFLYNKHIKNIDFTNIDFSECRSMRSICNNCSYLETATFGSDSNYDNVTDISLAFYNCSKLTHTNLMEVL